tara:strand:+ start:2453 stop:2776 length:324 start_codon:yes stop_codon:yes gene_type:complete
MQTNYVIQIQDIENYGLHSDEPSHYWKFKGGDLLVVENAPTRAATVIAVVNLLKCQGGMAFQSIIRGWDQHSEIPAEIRNDEWATFIDWADLEADANEKFDPEKVEV